MSGAVARTPDLERRLELLDRIVAYLAEHGLAQATLRPMAASLGVSINRLVHHFGTKDELIATAIRRVVEREVAVEQRWIHRNPNLSTADLYRKWWRWIIADPEHLALVRLGYEAAALDTTVSGLPGDLRADQLAVWRQSAADRLRNDGLPEGLIALEASLQKATFTGLVIDLVATGERRRLTQTLEVNLKRLEHLIATSTSGDQRAERSSS